MLKIDKIRNKIVRIDIYILIHKKASFQVFPKIQEPFLNIFQPKNQTLSKKKTNQS